MEFNDQIMQPAEKSAAVNDSIENKIKEWKKQYKDVYVLEAEGAEGDLGEMAIYCKAPSRIEMSRLIKDVADGDALKAGNNFFYGCLLYPDPEVVQKAVDQRPGLIVALSNKLQELTGINQGFTMRKL